MAKLCVHFTIVVVIIVTATQQNCRWMYYDPVIMSNGLQ